MRFRRGVRSSVGSSATENFNKIAAQKKAMAEKMGPAVMKSIKRHNKKEEMARKMKPHKLDKTDPWIKKHLEAWSR